MASVRFPQDRWAYTYTRPGEPLRLPHIIPLTITLDEAGMQPAPITTMDGEPIVDSVLYLTSDGMLPEFLCTLDRTVLWATPQGGSAYRLEAAYGPRVDAIVAGDIPRAYLHEQEIPSTVWDINHGLGFDPAGIRVEAVNGEQWLPVNVSYPQTGQVLRVEFEDSIAGKAWTS